MTLHAAAPEKKSDSELVTIDFGEAGLTLTGDRAVWWENERTLLVADVHLGKPASFRARGAPVPERVTANDLTRLGDLIRRFEAKTVVVLGDLAHDRAAWQTRTLDAFTAWRATHARVRVVLVRGNHDRWAADPPASLEVDVVEPGWVMGRDTAIAMHHEPPEHHGTHPVLCGHLHPGIRMRHARGRGRAGLRSACYWIRHRSPDSRAPMGVLPAFGCFTGCAVVRPSACDRVFAVGEGRVVEATPSTGRAN